MKDKYFIDDVVRVLELAKTAHDKFLRVDDNEKRKMINLFFFFTLSRHLLKVQKRNLNQLTGEHRL